MHESRKESITPIFQIKKEWLFNLSKFQIHSDTEGPELINSANLGSLSELEATELLDEDNVLSTDSNSEKGLTSMANSALLLKTFVSLNSSILITD